jgi:hypothetical protein
VVYWQVLPRLSQQQTIDFEAFVLVFYVVFKHTAALISSGCEAINTVSGGKVTHFIQINSLSDKKISCAPIFPALRLAQKTEERNLKIREAKI